MTESARNLLKNLFLYRQPEQELEQEPTMRKEQQEQPAPRELIDWTCPRSERRTWWTNLEKQQHSLQIPLFIGF